MIAMLVFGILLVQANAQDDNITRPTEPDVITLRYELNHSKAPQLIMDLLSSAQYKNYTNSSEEIVELKHLLQLASFSELNSTELNRILKHIGLNLSNPFADNIIENAFKTLNISIIVMYQAYTDSFVDKDLTSDALIDLGLSEREISRILAFDRTNTSRFFNELKNGTYSEENINNYLNRLNITRIEFVDKIVNTVGSQNIDDIFSLGTGTADILTNALASLEIPPEKYETVEPFASILSNYILKANLELTLATATGMHTFITLAEPWSMNKNLNLIGQVLDESSTSNVTISLNITDFVTQIYKTKFLKLASTSMNNTFVTIASNYTLHPSNCVVMLYNGGDIKTVPVNVSLREEYVYINIINDLKPNIATPLICDSFVYGLATGKNESESWQIITFKDAPVPTTTPGPGPGSPGTGGPSINGTTAIPAVTTTSNGVTVYSSIIHIFSVCVLYLVLC